MRETGCLDRWEKRIGLFFAVAHRSLACIVARHSLAHSAHRSIIRSVAITLLLASIIEAAWRKFETVWKLKRVQSVANDEDSISS